MRRLTTTKTVFLLLITLSFLIGCNSMIRIDGSNNLVEKNYDITDFTGIDVSNTFHVEIIQADTYKVIATFDDNLEEYIDVKKSGDILKIGLSGGFSYGDNSLSVKIYCPEINKIKASGATKIKITELDVENLFVGFSGASKLMGTLNISSNLSINSSGASVFELKGEVKNLTVNSSGASKFKGKEFLVKDKLIVDTSGASSTTINTAGDIEVDLSGASVFNYYGEGKIVRQNTSGASVVRKK